MSDSKPTDAQVIDVAHALNGSPQIIEYVMEDHGFSYDDVTQEQFQLIDDITWNCECCGWWVDTSEVEDGVCEQCREAADD